ncbi:hypothetical protein [Clostridium sp.]|uniref:hypothetical protein n=1 Tax=Clostridium sp. TaxID=1506 RepID=UPI003463EB7A
MVIKREMIKEEFSDLFLEDPIDEEDLDVILNSLEDFIVPNIDEKEIDKCISTVQSYVPRESKDLLLKAKEVYEKFKLETSYISMSYWICSILIFISLIGLAYYDNFEGTSIVMALTPIPVFLGIRQLFISMEEGVMELELSLKISFSERFIIRLIIITLFSIFINTSCIVFMEIIKPSVNILYDIYFSLSYIAIIMGVSLIICTNIRNTQVSLGTMSIFIALAELISLSEGMEAIIYANLMLYFIILGSVIVLSILSIKNFFSNGIEMNFYKG